MSERIPFLCECADLDCTALVLLSRGEYEHVRATGERFLSARTHEAASHPHTVVVEEHQCYLVVEKLGRAGEITQDLDPRGEGG